MSNLPVRIVICCFCAEEHGVPVESISGAEETRTVPVVNIHVPHADVHT